MTTSVSSAQDGASRSARDPLRGAARFVGITLGFAAIASVLVIASGAHADAALRSSLALSPAVIAIALAWREGHGALRQLFRQLAIRPANPVWYLALLIPLCSYLAVDVIAIALGGLAVGLFGDLFPAILIVPLVVALPAFAEEIAWRGFALPRTMTAMSPLRAAILLGIPWALVHPASSARISRFSVWSTVTQVSRISVILAGCTSRRCDVDPHARRHPRPRRSRRSRRRRRIVRPAPSRSAASVGSPPRLQALLGVETGARRLPTGASRCAAAGRCRAPRSA